MNTPGRIVFLAFVFLHIIQARASVSSFYGEKYSNPTEKSIAPQDSTSGKKVSSTECFHISTTPTSNKRNSISAL